MLKSQRLSLNTLFWITGGVSLWLCVTMPVFSQEAVRLQGLGLNLQADYPQASDLLALPEGKMTLDLNPLYLHPAV